ncbi:MAG: helix-turn-helix domain-containing protein [Candidatus Berkelbacteria bacterium]|nr:helix-turn-helix domain-containing protein [Candidatus Berkelbacteria bacterium]
MPPFFTTKKIKPPKTLGGILRGRRKKFKLSLRQIEKATKIKKVYLLALEANNWNELPSEVYIAGFLNTYSKTLKLDAKKIHKAFKDEHQAHKNIQRRVIENPKELKVNRVYLTPRMIIIGIVVIIALALGGYLWFQVSGFAAAPQLKISEPASQEVKTTDDKIQISGTTDTDSSVTLNNQPIPVSTSGQFEQNVSLSRGVNVFEIVSTNNVGKKTTKILQVMVE